MDILSKEAEEAKLRTEIGTSLEQVLEDSLIRHQDSVSGEVLIECFLCGEWDGHVNHCPIPAIDKYINSNITEAK